MQIPRSIDSLTNFFGVRFLVRAALDIPLTPGDGGDHLRVRQMIPTVTHLLERGARVIIITHVGRDPKNSTEPLVPILKKYFPVRHVSGVTEEFVYGEIAHMKEGTALILENLRAYEGEESNSSDFARKIASYADFYINDAFSVSHREHASIVGIPKILPNFGGFSLIRECTMLEKAQAPNTPSLFVLGGAKFETKAPLVAAFSTKYTHTFIGGALANDFLRGRGYDVGASVVSTEDALTDPVVQRENILLPTDVVVLAGDETRTVLVEHVRKQDKIYDVGPQTLQVLREHIDAAETIVWNGPLGYYEGGYDTATKTCARLIAESNAISIVGGGDTIAAIETLGLSEKFGFLSTAGGAMLEFLEKGTLPGIEALTKQE